MPAGGWAQRAGNPAQHAVGEWNVYKEHSQNFQDKGVNCCHSSSLFPIAGSAEVEDREAVTWSCHSGTMLADAAVGTTHFQDASV